MIMETGMGPPVDVAEGVRRGGGAESARIHPLAVGLAASL